MKQLHLKIYGKVQGVYFRETTVEKAKEFGVVGYVKNMPDGTVEVVAEGEEEALKKLLEWCKIGPRLAKVEMVQEEWKEVEVTEFNKFKIE
ncbi:MAG: acylphosphatase [Candidatus Magasanikiibacteriota bacterium]